MANENALPGGDGPPFGPGPYSAGEIRILNLLLEIKEKMGGTAHATRTLEDMNRIHDERLLAVIREADRTEAVIPAMQNTLTKHDKDLNELGKRLEKNVNELGQRHDREIGDLKNMAHTARVLGSIALTVITVIFTYLYLRLSK